MGKLSSLRRSWKDWILLTLVACMSIGANLPAGIAQRFGIERQLVLGALLVLLAIALVRYVKFLFVLAVAALVVGANLPADVARELNVDQGILIIALIGVVALSFANLVFKMLPTGTESGETAKTAQGLRTLLLAVRRGDVRTVQRLLEMGVDANAPDEHGDSALIHAARMGYADVVQVLLQHGADPGYANPQGDTACEIARARGYNRAAGLIQRA